MPLADDVDLERLAAGTVGLTGADIRNLVNEAALWATRHGKDSVDMADFEYARDKVLMGAKREEVLTGKEKPMTAYHEAGHALLAWLVPGIDRVHKVSIIPRGRSLGATQLLPEEDRVNISESELHARLLFCMGGRAAEKLVFDEFSAGAEDDLNQATQTRPPHGHPLGHERAARPGRLPRQRGASLPGQGNRRAARVQRAHGAGDRRRGRRASCARPPTRAARCSASNRDKLDCLAQALEQEETLDDWPSRPSSAPRPAGQPRRLAPTPFKWQQVVS